MPDKTLVDNETEKGCCKLNILILEDDPDLPEMYRDTIDLFFANQRTTFGRKGLDHEVTIVSDAKEAMREIDYLMRGKCYNIIISDYTVLKQRSEGDIISRDTAPTTGLRIHKDGENDFVYIMEEVLRVISHRNQFRPPVLLSSSASLSTIYSESPYLKPYVSAYLQKPATLDSIERTISELLLMKLYSNGHSPIKLNPSEHLLTEQINQLNIHRPNQAQDAIQPKYL
ncbi:MAG: hypothetical protein Q8O89_06590 [Nanoarchaeota archaeon]|nr:hypothetical protein [Nanoarchaeota archaeon]